MSDVSPLNAPNPAELDAPFSSLEHRHHQMFPTLSAAEIDSVRRFAVTRNFKTDELLFETGKVAPGLFVLVSGRVQMSSRDGFGRSLPVVQHGDGQMLAEMAQLTGKPSLLDGRALCEVETLLIEPVRLRALIVADALLGERIMRALILRRVGLIERGIGPILIGAGDQRKLLALQGFLRRNGYPATVIDSRNDSEAVALLAGMTTRPEDFPLVFCPNGSVLKAPDEMELAACLGLVPAFVAGQLFDVAIVGAGPAGLAASVYAASEGLSVAVFDQRAPGGQAGASSRIENYLGFPTGISGQALAARAYQQAQKFGVHLAIPSQVETLARAGAGFLLQLRDRQSIGARTVVIASGAAYRKPAVPGVERFEGRGVYYWASPIEAKLVRDQDVVLIGGGNSAGQAVVFLARFARRVRILIRGAGLHASMSRYLIDRIESLPNVELCTGCRLSLLDGDESGLTEVHIRHAQESRDEVVATRHLFLFIGADPKTDWLDGSEVRLDDRGFVIAGKAANDHEELDGGEVAYTLGTTVPGVFAIGDVRSGSTKRVASAVGDGAAVVSQIHDYLSRQALDDSGDPMVRSNEAATL